MLYWLKWSLKTNSNFTASQSTMKEPRTWFHSPLCANSTLAGHKFTFMHIVYHPSIQRLGCSDSRVLQASLSPAMLSSSTWGTLRCSQARRVGVPEAPWSDTWTTSIGSFSTPRRSDSTQSSLQMSELLSLSQKAKPSHSPEIFGRLCLWIFPCPSGHYPEFMTIGESQNIDRQVNQEFHLDSTAQYSACINMDATPNCLSIDQDPNILEFPGCRTRQLQNAPQKIQTNHHCHFTL